MNKVTYTDDVTVIEAQNLNDIQDAIIRIDPDDSTGKIIPENADLNTYTTPGFYFCANSATAATLSNSPVTSAGFSLVVLAKSTTYQTQLINSGGYLYFRQRSSNGWSAWYSTALLEINNTFKGVLRVQQENSNTSNTQSLVSIGNNIPEGTVGASYGGLQLFGSNDKYVFLRPPTTALGASRTIYLPDDGGTIALENVVNKSSNSFFTVSSGYNVTSKYWYQTGKVVYIYLNIKKTDSSALASSRINAGTLASGYRPMSAVAQMVPASNGVDSYMNRQCAVVIQADGVIYLDNYFASDVKTVYVRMSFLLP